MHRLILLFVLQTVTAQLGDIIPYEASRFSECQALVSTCHPVIATCASIACQQCFSLGDKTFQSCCGQPTPSYCFSTEYDGGSGGGNAGITTTAVDPNLSICQTAVTILQNCESATSNFDNLAGTVQAECLCYSGSSWVPDLFDGPWSSCAAYASTSDVSDYPGFFSAEGLCSSAGNVLAAVASSSQIRSVIASTTPVMSSAASPLETGNGGVVTEASTANTVEGSTSTPTSSVVKPTTTASGGSLRIMQSSPSIIALGLLIVLLSL